MDLKTINIKGKEYVTVAERVRAFNELFPNGDIQPEMTYEGNYVRCKAIVTPDKANPTRFFVGHSEEDRTQGNINKTNATENCETSAVGRALGMMGIGIVEGIASADEMVRFEQKAQTPVSAPTTQPSASGAGWETYTFAFGKHKGKTMRQVDEESPDYLSWLEGKDNSKYPDLVKALEGWRDALPSGLTPKEEFYAKSGIGDPMGGEFGNN